jgi:hypothetical protein
VSEAIDHDRLFKELLTNFFLDFLKLFVPYAADLLDGNSFEFIDKELFTDVTSGERWEVDIVAKGMLRGESACFLIHVENQASRKGNFAERMFLYGARLYEKHRLPVFPVALLSYDAPRNPEPNVFEFRFGNFAPLRYEFQAIQLNRLNWRDFINTPNPVASALMAKMAIAPEDRVAVKFECLRLLATLKLDPARMRLISGFIDTYLPLVGADLDHFNEKVATLEPEPKEAVMQIMTSWKEEGRQEGILLGRSEGEAKIVLRLLGRLFGDQLESEVERIEALPVETLEELADALLGFKQFQDLVGWLDGNAQTRAIS